MAFPLVGSALSTAGVTRQIPHPTEDVSDGTSRTWNNSPGAFAARSVSGVIKNVLDTKHQDGDTRIWNRPLVFSRSGVTNQNVLDLSKRDGTTRAPFVGVISSQPRSSSGITVHSLADINYNQVPQPLTTISVSGTAARANTAAASFDYLMGSPGTAARTYTASAVPQVLIFLDASGSMARTYTASAIPLVISPPANNLLSGRVTLTGDSGSTTFTTALSNLETGEASLTVTDTWSGATRALQGAASVWFEWVAPHTKNYVFHTFNTPLEFDTLHLVNGLSTVDSVPDTTLSVWTSSGAPSSVTDLTAVAFNDDVFTVPDFALVHDVQANPQRVDLSIVDFSATAGTTYYIRVAGFSSTQQGPCALDWLIEPQTVIHLEADMFPNGGRYIEASAVTMTVDTTLDLDAVTIVSASAVTMAFADDAFVTGDVIVWSRYIGEPQTTLSATFAENVLITQQSGVGSLDAVFSLTTGHARIATLLAPTWTLIESGDVGIYVGSSGGGVVTGTTVNPDDDGVDVPFEATTGVRVATEATLSFSVPDFDIHDAERSLLRVSPLMRTPVIINGRPWHPDMPIAASSRLDVAIHVAPKPSPASDPPSTGPNHGNKTPVHRWLAQDFPFSYGTYGDQWPAHGGNGPTWHSYYPYRPKKEQYEGEVDYDDVLVFWWHYVEHMWATFSHSQPFTFIITGILHGGTGDQHQHLMDRGNPATTVFDTPGGETGTVSDGSARNFVHVRPTHVQQSAGSIYTGKAHLYHKAAIYTVTFNGDQSYIDVHMQGYHQRANGHAGADSVSTVLLGRQNGWVSPYHASHMSLLEVDFFNYALTDEELAEIKKHMFALYSLHKW